MLHGVSSFLSENYYITTSIFPAHAAFALPLQRALSTAIAPARPSPRHNTPPRPLMTPRVRAEPFVVLEDGGAVDTPFADALVVVNVVTGRVILLMPLLLILLGEMTVEMAVVVAVVGVGRDKVEGPMIGIELLNEIGGDGVAEVEKVAVTVVVEPPERVVMVMTPESVVEEDEAELSDCVPEDVPVEDPGRPEEKVTIPQISPKALLTAACCAEVQFCAEHCRTLEMNVGDWHEQALSPSLHPTADTAIVTQPSAHSGTVV